MKAIPEHWHQLPLREGQLVNKQAHWVNALCLFNGSDQPIPLKDAVTRTVYHRLVLAYIETPIGEKAWEDNFHER